MTPSDSVFDADPSSGLSVDARGEPGARAGAGHSHGSSCRCGGADRGGQGAPAAGSRPSEASGFVRAAVEADLPAMGAVHAASMLASLAVGHDGPLPESVRAMVSAPVIAAGWGPAVTAPPTRAHRTLVATDDGAVVGLLGLAPTEDPAADGPDGPGSADVPDAGAGARHRTVEKASEITALGVAPDHQHRGHGSRLLAAAVDLAREDGAALLTMWVVRGDESLARLLTSAGLRATCSYRRLPVGDGIVEDCWAAAL